jgi:hypothetical protein
MKAATGRGSNYAAATKRGTGASRSPALTPPVSPKYSEGRSNFNRLEFEDIHVNDRLRAEERPTPKRPAPLLKAAPKPVPLHVTKGTELAASRVKNTRIEQKLGSDEIKLKEAEQRIEVATKQIESISTIVKPLQQHQALLAASAIDLANTEKDLDAELERTAAENEELKIQIAAEIKRYNSLRRKVEAIKPGRPARVNAAGRIMHLGHRYSKHGHYDQARSPSPYLQDEPRRGKGKSRSPSPRQGARRGRQTPEKGAPALPFADEEHSPKKFSPPSRQRQPAEKRTPSRRDRG